MAIESAAAQALVKLARGDRASAKRITTVIRTLAEDPRPVKSTKLVGTDAWRIRVGDFRVAYLIEDSILVVSVTRIAHRREVYGR